MTDLKPGDRVCVEFEGDVNYTTPTRVYIDVNGERRGALVHPANCTVITPPVKVGDVLQSMDQVDALTPGTCILDSDGDAARRTDTRWAVSGFERLQESNFFSYPVTVLWLPE